MRIRILKSSDLSVGVSYEVFRGVHVDGARGAPCIEKIGDLDRYDVRPGYVGFAMFRICDDSGARLHNAEVEVLP